MCNFAHQKQVIIMYQTSTNIIPKYRYETHYNYVRSSVFFASNCSPLLCYRSVTTALTAQIPAETLSQSHRLCFMLLHYHYVSTSLTMQIPAETLSQSHRLFLVLRFCAIVSLPLHLPHKFLTETLSRTY